LAHRTVADQLDPCGIECCDKFHQRIDIAPLDSMRWIVGTESPASSASCRWSMPSSARAARDCAAVINALR
jgi:hypothetical protein